MAPIGTGTLIWPICCSSNILRQRAGGACREEHIRALDDSYQRKRRQTDGSIAVALLAVRTRFELLYGNVPVGVGVAAPTSKPVAATVFDSYPVMRADHHRPEVAPARHELGRSLTACESATCLSAPPFPSPIR